MTSEALVWSFLLLSCAGRKDEHELPDVLVPLEENRAPPPAPVNGDEHPEILSVISGGDSDLWWAHGRGYLKADAASCWAALSDPEVVVDRREISEWSVEWDIAPQFDVSFVLHNVAHDVITVAYDLTWLHELQEGEQDSPARVVGVWEKSDGTAFIDLLEGSFVIRSIGDNLTEIELVEHLKAPLRDDTTLASYLRDLYGSVLARVHGDPLPAY